MGGGAARVERQHKEGKLSARERVELLLDEGTFEELDRLITHRATDFDLASQRIPGDGVVGGTETCDDGLACTTLDRCSDGVCVGGDTCPEGQVCDVESGECEVGGGCGDGTVDGTDQCDDGDTEWLPGESCDATCQLVACGDPDDTGTTRASDALLILRVAVGSESCDPCVCNVDNSTTGNPVSASDALRVLRAAVGNPVELSCPACA